MAIISIFTSVSETMLNKAIKAKIKQQNAREYASDYDRSKNVAYVQVYDNMLFKRWKKKITSGSLILDLGCGTGRSSRPFVTDNQVCGIDISIHMLNEARKLNSENLFLVVGDVENLPIKDGTFDAVISYGTFHHLPDPFKGLSEAYRVLRYGGKLFAVEANRTNLRKIDEFYARLFKLSSNILHLYRRFSVDKAAVETNKEKGEIHHPGHPGKRYAHEYTKELEAYECKVQLSTILFSFIPRQVFYNRHFLAKLAIKFDQILDRLPLLKGKGHILILEIEKDKS